MTNPIPPVVIPTFPTSSVQPFTYKDGMSYLEILERLRGYITKTLVPWLENEINNFEDSVEDTVNKLIDEVLHSSVELQDPVITGILANSASEFRTALNAILANVVHEDTKDAGTFIINSQQSATNNVVSDPSDPGFFV